MTVEELPAIMLAKREIYVAANDRMEKPIDATTAASLAKLLAEAHFARDTWVTARDFGITAALMFKLSDGSMDPRYPAR